MIQAFHAAVCAKCARLSLQQIGNLKSIMFIAEFQMFGEKGMFVARTTSQFCGTKLDWPIEQCLMKQCLMRLVMVTGGRGRAFLWATITGALIKYFLLCTTLQTLLV